MQSFRHINNKPALDQLFLVLPSVQYFCVPLYLCIIYFFLSLAIRAEIRKEHWGLWLSAAISQGGILAHETNPTEE